MQVPKTENTFLYVVKAICAYIVVIAHCRFDHPFFEVLFAAGTFVVPIFFLSSGYFSAYDPPEQSVKKLLGRAKRLLPLILSTHIVYLLCHVLIRLTTPAKLKVWLAETFTLKNLIKLVFLNDSPLSPSLWFLFALMYCYLLMAVVVRFRLTRYAVWCIPLLLAANILGGELLPLFGFMLPVSLLRNAYFFGFPFFLAGYWMQRHQDDRIKSDRVGVLFLVFLCCMGFSFAERIYTVEAQMSVGSIFSALVLFVIILRKPTWGTGGLFAIIGKRYSLSIYLWHYLFILLLTFLISCFDMETNALFLYLRPILVIILSTLWAVAERAIGGVAVGKRRCRKVRVPSGGKQ